MGFLVPPEKALIWRGPMAHGAFRQLATQTDWGELDYLVIDLPPGTSDAALTVIKAARRPSEKIHQHHIGIDPADLIQRLLPVARLSHYLEVVVGGQECPQAATDHLVIIDDEYTDTVTHESTAARRAPARQSVRSFRHP